jgi:hypothetical protein
MMQRALVAVGVAAALTVGPAQADDASRVKDLEARVEQSLKAIEALRQEIKQLANSRTVSNTVPAPPEANARIEVVERTVNELATNASRPVDNGVPLHGFADVGWARRSGAANGGTSGYRLGTFDLYLTPQLSERVKSVIELAFEVTPEGGVATDLERMQMGYLFGDELTLWFGRFHTPYGYWNTAYHHGAQIQTSITRPRFLAFEDLGGIVPAHSVGAWGTGAITTGLGKLKYDLIATNGNRITDGVLDFNASGDDNNSPALGFRVGISPGAVPGLTVGAHGMRQNVAGNNSAGTANGSARMQFLGGYLYYESDRWEVLGEYYGFRNRDLGVSGGPTLPSWAGYMQAGYNVADRWTAFARWEKSSLNAADPYFALQDSGRSYETITGGLRFELDPRTALKFQVDRTKEGSAGGASTTWMRTQFAIRF